MDPNTAFALPTVPGPPTQSGDWARQAPDWAEFEREAARALPEGVRLQDYEIAGPIGEGGFGIVYLAWDPAQERHVAIKEYLPAVLASRARASTGVIVRSPRHDDSFRIGLRSFLNEARILARFDHPALVRVLHYWEGNGTAYMAMPYYQGPTLARALAELGRPPEEAELRRWLRPLLDALGTLHAVRCLHRDIAPDNILLTEGGPVLLDFGAARRVIDGAGQSPTVVFKPGFTPLEQYGELASMRQGPWTDLYALAAVVYTAIAGQPPISSVERMPDDPLRPLSVLARGRYSEPFLAAIDAALAVHPQDRPQSAAELWARLGDEGKTEAPAAEPATPAAASTQPPEAAVAVQALHAGGRGFMPSQPEPAAPRVEPFAAMAPRPRPRSAPARRSRMGLWALSGTVVLAGLVAAGYYRIGDPVRTVPPLAVQATLPPPLPAAQAARTVAAPPVPVTPAPAVKAEATTPAPVAKAVPMVPAPAVKPAPVAPAPAPVAKAAPAVPPPAISALLPSQAPAAKVEAAPPRPVAAPDPVWGLAPVPASKPPRPPAEPLRTARREPRPPVAEAPPAPEGRQLQAEAAPPPGRCSELLQRASLGPLAAGEVALLRKGCE